MKRVPVTIRPYRETDAAEVCEAVRESMAELVPWMPWCHPQYSEHDAISWIRATLDGFISGAIYDFAVFDADGRYTGGCGVNQIRTSQGAANLGYWVRSSRAGRGIAPAAALKVVDWTWHHTPLTRLEIVAAVDNLRSQRVAEKVGARRERIVQERLVARGAPYAAVLYSLTRNEHCGAAEPATASCGG